MGGRSSGSRDVRGVSLLKYSLNSHYDANSYVINRYFTLYKDVYVFYNYPLFTFN